MISIFILSLFLGAGSVVYRYLNMQHTYAQFINGQYHAPLLPSKAARQLRKFYKLPYREGYTLEITAPFLSAFLEEQEQDYHPVDLQFLRAINATPRHGTPSQKQMMINTYIERAKKRKLTPRSAAQNISEIVKQLKQLPPAVWQYYQKRDVQAIIDYAQRYGRNETLDTILYLLISEISVKANVQDAQQTTGAYWPAIQELYMGYATGESIQQTMNNVLQKIKDRELRLLCYLRLTLTSWFNISPIVDLQYLLRRPQSCVYDPETYSQLVKSGDLLKQVDTNSRYAGYTTAIENMMRIYTINYTVNIFQSLHRSDPKYATNMLVALLIKIPSIRILVIDNTGKKLYTLNRGNIDLFFRKNYEHQGIS